MIYTLSFIPLISVKWANSKIKHLGIHIYIDIFCCVCTEHIPKIALSISKTPCIILSIQQSTRYYVLITFNMFNRTLLLLILLSSCKKNAIKDPTVRKSPHKYRFTAHSSTKISRISSFCIVSILYRHSFFQHER